MKKTLFTIAVAIMIMGCNQKGENKPAPGADNPNAETKSPPSVANTKAKTIKFTLNPRNGFFYEKDGFKCQGYFYKTYLTDNTGFGYTHSPAEGFPKGYGASGSYYLGYYDGNDHFVQAIHAYNELLQIALPYDATVTVKYNFSVVNGTRPVTIYLNNAADTTHVKSKNFQLQNKDQFDFLLYTCKSVNKSANFFFQCSMKNADASPLQLFSIDIEVKE